MKKLHLLGLAAVVVFAFSAFTAASAFALESTWLVDNAKPAVAVNSTSEGELLLEDLKGGLFLEDAQVECKGTDEGTVGPGPADKLTKVVVNGCKNELKCPEPDTASAVNLPWNTKVVLLGTAFYDELTSATTVGYTVTCAGFATDTCTLTTGFVKLTNGSGVVVAEFSGTDTNQPPASCTRGGANQGLVFGNDIISVAGKALAVSEG